MARLSHKRSGGIAVLDLLVAISIMAIVMVIVIPSSSATEPVRLVGAATTLVADVEFAQSATLAAPGDPTIVRFDEVAGRYWLALESAPETPIERPGSNGDPYERVYGGEVGEVFEGVSFDLPDGVDTLEFDSFGRLIGMDDFVVTLTNESGDLWVVVAAATGSTSIENLEPGS